MLATYWLQAQPLLYNLTFFLSFSFFNKPLRDLDSLGRIRLARLETQSFERKVEGKAEISSDASIDFCNPFACSPPLPLVLHIPLNRGPRADSNRRSFSFEQNGWPPVGFPGSIMHRWRGASLSLVGGKPPRGGEGPGGWWFAAPSVPNHQSHRHWSLPPSTLEQQRSLLPVWTDFLTVRRGGGRGGGGGGRVWALTCHNIFISR